MKRVILLCLAFAGACADAEPEIGSARDRFAAGTLSEAISTFDDVCPVGTTLTATKCATGFDERTITYDWTLQKTVTPAAVTIPANQTGTVTYTLTATRTEVGRSSHTGVSGDICVTNTGGAATEDLTIVDQIECQTAISAFSPVPGATQTITPQTQLGPGDSACYPYEITPFAFPADATACRNTAHVTITNYAGNIGQAFGPTPVANFTMPAPAITEIDESASVQDVESCPAGFTCTPSALGPFTFTSTGNVQYNTTIQNVSATCDTRATLVNTATLTENDTGQQHTASASVDIDTGTCTAGCTHTLGFWKTHAGFTGNNPDLVTPLLPISLGTPGGADSVLVTTATQAVTLLTNSGGASNGISKLYVQLLTAKLDIADGAAASAIASTIAAADAFLANHDAASFTSLTNAQKQQVLAWAGTLDDYNNGLIGPGHCGD